MRKAIPFLKDIYFSKREESILFSEIYSFVEKYQNLPTKETILVEMGYRKDLNDQDVAGVKDLVAQLSPEDVDSKWLIDTTEKFCKDRAVHNAVLDGIKILDGKDKERQSEAIPSILADALSVSFDNHIGHDYLNDSDERFNWYHTKEKKYQFDLGYFNRITKGGVPSKTLNICLAGTGVGKSLFMCHVAASFLAQGLNVLYITLEMAEERIAERIDANLLDVSMDDLHDMPKSLYEDKITKIKDKTKGQLIIKEYPTASAHSGHFRDGRGKNCRKN